MFDARVAAHLRALGFEFTSVFASLPEGFPSWRRVIGPDGAHYGFLTDLEAAARFLPSHESAADSRGANLPAFALSKFQLTAGDSAAAAAIEGLGASAREARVESRSRGAR